MTKSEELEIRIKAVDQFSSTFDSAERRASALAGTMRSLGAVSGARDASKIGRILEAVSDGGKDLEAASLNRRVGILQEYRSITDEIVRIQRLGTTNAIEWNALEEKRVDITRKAAAAYEQQAKDLRSEKTNAFVTRLGAAVGIAELVGNRLQRIGNEYERIAKWADETNASASQFAGEVARTLPGIGSMAKGFDGIRDSITDIIVRMGSWGNDKDDIRAARAVNAVLTLGGSELTGSMSGTEARIRERESAARTKDANDFHVRNAAANKAVDDITSSLSGSREMDARERATEKLKKQLSEIREAAEAVQKRGGNWKNSDDWKELLAAEVEARRQHQQAIDEVSKQEIELARESASRRVEIEREVQVEKQSIVARSLRLAGKELDADLTEIEARHRASVAKILSDQEEIWRRYNAGKIDKAARDGELAANDQAVENEMQRRRLDEADANKADASRREIAVADAESVLRRAEMAEIESRARLGDTQSQKAMERLRIEEKHLAIQKQLKEIIEDQNASEDVRSRARIQLVDSEQAKQNELAAIERDRHKAAEKFLNDMLAADKGFNAGEVDGTGFAARAAQEMLLRRSVSMALVNQQVASQNPSPAIANSTQPNPTNPTPTTPNAQTDSALMRDLLTEVRGLRQDVQNAVLIV